MIPSRAYKLLIGHKYISLFKGGQKIKKHKAKLENLFNFALSLYYVPFTGKFCLFWDTLVYRMYDAMCRQTKTKSNLQ
jgi:hypothetical protein